MWNYNKIPNKMEWNIHYIGWTLQAVCLACLFSCTQESDTEYPGSGQDAEMKAVTLQVGASGSVQTRAYGEDEAAIAGEFMNSLRLYVVDDRGVVEKAVNATADKAFVPKDGEQGGCETSYTTTVTLRPGHKTIYAFANAEGHTLVSAEEGLDAKLAGIEEGTLWADAGWDGAVVADPASKIDLTDVFIPMTAKREVSIPVEDGNIRIELVRLVGKIRPRLVSDKAQGVRVTALSVGRFADRVPLFEGGDAGEVSQEQVRTFSLDRTVGNDPMDLFGYGEDGRAVLVSGEGKAVPEIYVNETEDSEPFEITLEIDGKDMGGKTVATSVPRNHYMPLALNLSDFQLIVTAYVAPIGGYPVAVMTGPSLTDNYEVAVPEGCTFSVSGVFGQSGGKDDLPVTAWTWSVPEGQNTVSIQSSLTDLPLWGSLTAMPGQTVMLGFEVTAPRLKSGTLTLKTEALRDGEEYGVRARGAVRWTERVARYEIVRMGYIR